MNILKFLKKDKKVIKQIFWAFLLDAWRYDELL